MKQPIRIYNSFMNLLHETDKYISLRIVPKFYEIGEFELHVSQYIEGAEYFQKGNVIIPNKRGDKAMLIRHREIALDESGKASENWKITGVTLDGVLDQRITVPPSDTGYDRKQGNAETVMKHYVYNHFVNPADPTRRIDQIEIAPNLNRGIEISWESRYKYVADEIVSISKQANLGFVIYADMTLKKWIFDVVEPRNLTKDNPGGLPPVFFSPDFQTIKNQLFVDSDLNLKNVGYVGGQGEGAERTVIKVGQGVGLQRKETFIDARDVGNPEEEEELTEEEMEELLIQRGEEKMREFLTNFYLEAQILTPTINDHSGRFALRSPFEYEVDFRLGDVVEVFNKNWNITMDAPITEFTEIYEASGFLLEATFGEAQPTLITKIKNKFDDIEGVEKQEFPVKVAVEQMKQAIHYSDERLSEEEKKRIEQAMENLEKALSYTKKYAEKKRVESKTAPSDTEVIWIDTSDPNNIIWKVWNGSEWVAGPSGPQGIPGPPGEKGEPLYTWLKYADDAQGNGMSDSPDGKPYMGIAYNKQSPTESSNPKDYSWSKVEGEQGPQGPKGTDGTPRYTWIKYANSATGSGMSDSPVGKQYLGIAYNKTTANESTNPLDYEWSKIEGPQGPNKVDKDTTFGDKWLVARYIESLNGLNVGQGQFVVDADGNVKFAGHLVGASGTFGDVSVKGGDFKLEDDVSGMEYSATPKRNLIKDHSFELIRPDPDSLNSDSVKYNWLEILPNQFYLEDTPWERMGSPKVAIQFAPDSKKALAMFGEKAIIVRNANYVRQYVYDGVGAGSIYTVSAFFKRQWQVVGGGIPRIEIWHVNAAGNRVSTIVNSTFDPVSNDYSVSRHSTTFTVPSSFESGDSLEVIISGGDDKWIQCDGVQMVEGDIASVYQPEDSIWEITQGNYRPMRSSKILWSGTRYPTDAASQTIVPELPLSKCRNGWILQWQSYTVGSGVNQRQVSYTFIPKEAAEMNEGKSHSVSVPLNDYSNTGSVFKYLYFNDVSISGHAQNDTGSSNMVALTRVYEF
ncbi:siphovirus ReqiPepy6 Gp37-like family protein [Cytobacillus sp. FSL K6-0129]|uniref:siphovirus ReqiPepy6 Gp37-like family protein n=1 Tax=Cytobacillus sp. FSL K6-0129 TaxID=2921421 RepID=UPI0030FC915A